MLATHPHRPLISICIPAYNRPSELVEVLNSIAIQGEGPWDVVICEDHSPRGDEIELVVTEFAIQHPWLRLNFYRNLQNLGYDGNLRRLIERAEGEFTMFVGDDDLLLPGSLHQTVDATRYPGVGVILRAWRSSVKFTGEVIEEFFYFPDNRVFPASAESAAALFRRSIFISGLTIRRDAALALATAEIDGTLLYQLYLVGRIACSHNSYYISNPTVMRRVGGQHFFGSAAAEKGRFAPRELTVQHSLNFIRGIFHVAAYTAKHMPANAEFEQLVRQDFARYSYPMLDIQARRISRFRLAIYVGDLAHLGLWRSVYFWIYTISLFCLGPRLCAYTIRTIKHILGRTPNLGGAAGLPATLR
jgi:glycosyltransferase involved in cell wall biosynthesis